MSDPKPTDQTLAERTAVYQQMDSRDENQIVKELLGETMLLEEYVYSFKQGNRQVTSLSYAGVKEMVRKRGHFSILNTKIEENDKTIRALVTIRDLDNCVDFLGASEAEKDKPFAYVLAVNKAERNAYMKAMPAKLLANMVDAFLHSGKAEAPATAAPQQTNTPQQPAPKPAIAAHPDDVYAEFSAANLTDYFDFKDMADHIVIKPREFLGSDIFAAAKTIVQNLNGVYVSQGKESHFRVPLVTEAKQ